MSRFTFATMIYSTFPDRFAGDGMFVFTDNDSSWYIDGELLVESHLFQLKSVAIPNVVRVFAFQGYNFIREAFAVMTTTSGISTNTSWKCSNTPPQTNGKHRATMTKS